MSSPLYNSPLLSVSHSHLSRGVSQCVVLREEEGTQLRARGRFLSHHEMDFKLVAGKSRRRGRKNKGTGSASSAASSSHAPSSSVSFSSGSSSGSSSSSSSASSSGDAGAAAARGPAGPGQAVLCVGACSQNGNTTSEHHCSCVRARRRARVVVPDRACPGAHNTSTTFSAARSGAAHRRSHFYHQNFFSLFFLFPVKKGDSSACLVLFQAYYAIKHIKRGRRATTGSWGLGVVRELACGAGALPGARITPNRTFLTLYQ